MPKTANLLACKRWWKVCFPHGDQEKYYRQIYGRAAAQRLVNAQNAESRVTFPTKLHRPVAIENRLHEADYQSKAFLINMLDDPFLFKIKAVNENSSDSGIDANFTATNVHKTDVNKEM